MKYLLIIPLFFLSACANFQLPNIMVQDKESGKLIGCKPVPERDIQMCEYEGERFKFLVELPIGDKPPETAVPK